MKVDEMVKNLKGMASRLDKVEEKRQAKKAAAEAAEEETISNVINTKGHGMSHPVAGASSDEKRAMAAYGCRNVPELLKVNTGLPRFKRLNERHPELKELVMNLKHTVDNARFIAQLFHGAPADKLGSADEKADRISRIKGLEESSYYAREELTPRLKSFGSSVSAEGGAWIPTLIASSYIDEYELDHVVEERFPVHQLRSKTDELPKKKNVTKARQIGEKAQISDTNFETDVISFSAVKFGEFYCMPEELIEDSMPDVFAAGREELVLAHMRAIESAILNGDKDGTHIDADTQLLGADVPEKHFDGLRKRALASANPNATTDFGAGAITEALLSTQRARMGKFGSMPGDLVWIASPVGYIQMQALPNVATIDKFGPNASVLRGALAAYQGIPIINSEHMRDDLNAAGVQDGFTTDKSGLLLVNYKRFFVGLRRPIQMRVMPDLADYDRQLMAAYQRKDFNGHDQDANEVSISYGINIQV